MFNEQKINVKQHHKRYFSRIDFEIKHLVARYKKRRIFILMFNSYFSMKGFKRPFRAFQSDEGCLRVKAA